VKLLLAEWSESFAAAIASALGSDSEFIADEVKNGVCQAWLFVDGKETIGHAITRLETETLVVVAYEGKDVEAFADMIVRICETKQLPYARFHTVRPGLNKLLARFNPEPLEYVMRVKCYGR